MKEHNYVQHWLLHLVNVHDLFAIKNVISTTIFIQKHLRAL